MEMLCPECLGPLATSDGKKARCTLHGGQYDILFSKWEPPPPMPAAQGTEIAPPADASGAPVMDIRTKCPNCGQEYDVPPAYVGQPVDCQNCNKQFVITAEPQRAPETTGTTCIKHPQMLAEFSCRICGSPICRTCAFPSPDGTWLCPDCVMKPAEQNARAPSYPPASAPRGVMCAKHPEVPAIQVCKTCGKGVCQTCDFVFANVHICPDCAAKPQTTLSRKRKTSLVWSYVLVAWSTMCIMALLCGVRAAAYFILIPSLIGLGLAFGSFDRRLVNPVAVWISVVWNCIVVGIFVILLIVGLVMGAGRHL